jgi:outer membrane protein W
MKKILTIIGLTTTMALYVNNANAQKSSSIGIDFGFYKGTSSVSEGLIGPMIQGRYALKDEARLGLNFGYYFKSSQLSTLAVNPITATFEYLFSKEDFKPYAGLDVGIYRSVVRFKGNLSGTISSTNFGLAPTLGFDYAVSDKFGINANFKYNYIITSIGSGGAISLNAGVYFKF